MSHHRENKSEQKSNSSIWYFKL